jgi:hypothetical protein
MKKAGKIIQDSLFPEEKPKIRPDESELKLTPEEEQMFDRMAAKTRPQKALSKRTIRRAKSIESIRLRRETQSQQVCFSSRPFVLTGLPIRRPDADVREYRRRNGNFFLTITGHPDKGLPFGQDRLIPIWMATLAKEQKSRIVSFEAASDFLKYFGIDTNGAKYDRLIEGFERIFWATIVFGTDIQTEGASVFGRSRFNFFKSIRLWRSHDEKPPQPGNHQNVIELSHEFYEEICNHPIPVDLNVVKALSDSPGNLDFYTWIVWRCWKLGADVEIPLHGPNGLIHQLGVSDETTKKEFTRRIRDWLKVTYTLWPECPAKLKDSDTLIVTAALTSASAINNLPPINPSQGF